MSKICDVKNMYGQDFNIVTTNAPSNIIKNSSEELLSNTLLISSPNDDNGNDNNMPSLFVTDYNATPLQLTYPFYIGNGLSCADSGYLFINIDNETIKTEKDSGKLIIDTSYLTSASSNNKGVVKVNDTISFNRNLNGKYPDKSINVNSFNDKSFISIDNTGVIYVNDNLLNLINSIVDIRVKQKINYLKVLMNVNLKMWIEVIEIDDVPVNSKNYTYNVGTTNNVDIDNSKMTKLLFNLHYLSFDNESDTVTIEDESGKMFNYEFLNDNKTTVMNVPDNDELYEHILSNIVFTFCPNYFIVNNSSYDQEYRIIFNINEDNQSAITFTQNKFKFIDNEGSRNFDIVITGHNESPESIFVDNALTDDSYAIITNEIRNNNIFKDIIFNGNDYVINYKFESFIYNMYDNRHYLLHDEDINFATDSSQFIKLTNTIIDGDHYEQSNLYKFLDAILQKNGDNTYVTVPDDNNPNVIRYKIKEENSIITFDSIGNSIGTVPINNFVETFKNDQNEIEYQQIYIMSKLSVTNYSKRQLMGEYTIKTPLKLNLVKN